MPDVQVTVTPSYILRSVHWTSGPLSYDADRRVLTYRRDRQVADQTVQFVFPTVQDGYALTVETVEGSRDQAVAEYESIFLPAVAMFQEFTADATFDPTARALPPFLPRLTVRFTVRIRPLDEE